MAPNLDEPETSFSSAKYAMVLCAPLLDGGLRTVTFMTETMKVWVVISVVTRDLYCWTYVKSDQRENMEGTPTVTCGTISWYQIMWITWQVSLKCSLSPRIILMNVSV